jgi:glycosyltransferase involved in cell wall biosynthesis
VSFLPQTRSHTALPVTWLRSAYARWSVQQAYRHADLITGCSHAVLSTIGTLCSAGGSATHAVMRYGIPDLESPSQREREGARAELGIAPTDQIVLSIGSLRAQKNHEAVIRIAQHVCRCLPNTRFLVVGEGPLRTELTTQIQNAKLAKEVRLLGKRSDIARLLAVSDVMLFPSKWEGFGIVALEAQMCRVPVVGSDISALHEATLVNKSSLLFDVDDEGGMGNAVLELLMDRERRRYMGEQGKKFVGENYSLSNSVECLQSTYREVVARKCGSGASRVTPV